MKSIHLQKSFILFPFPSKNRVFLGPNSGCWNFWLTLFVYLYWGIIPTFSIHNWKLTIRVKKMWFLRFIQGVEIFWLTLIVYLQGKNRFFLCPDSGCGKILVNYDFIIILRYHTNFELKKIENWPLQGKNRLFLGPDSGCWKILVNYDFILILRYHTNLELK